jgi:hypothetical protein
MVKIDFIENSGAHKMFNACLFGFNAQDTELENCRLQVTGYKVGYSSK